MFLPASLGRPRSAIRGQFPSKPASTEREREREKVPKLLDLFRGSPFLRPRLRSLTSLPCFHFVLAALPWPRFRKVRPLIHPPPTRITRELLAFDSVSGKEKYFNTALHGEVEVRIQVSRGTQLSKLCKLLAALARRGTPLKAYRS